MDLVINIEKVVINIPENKKEEPLEELLDGTVVEVHSEDLKLQLSDGNYVIKSIKRPHDPPIICKNKEELINLL